MSHNVMRKVVFQLDYHMSAQFAGVAVALRRGLYEHAGISLQCRPPCRPGDEAKIVADGFQADGGANLWVGSMEQNTLLPAVSAGCQVKAVSAMFGRSPLCIAGLPGSRLLERVGRAESMRVGAHVDTLEILRRLLPSANIVEVPREEKMSLLLRGDIDAVQAYDVTETLRLQHDLRGAAPEAIPLEGPAFPGAALGYSQVLFAPSAAILDVSQRRVLHDFVSATFEGWSQAMDDPSAAAEAVLALQEEGLDHWLCTPEFAEQSVRLCCDYVSDTRYCGELGTIDLARWARAAAWLGRVDSPAARAAGLHVLRPPGATPRTRALEAGEVVGRLESTPGWALGADAAGRGALQSDFWFPSYPAAVEFVGAVTAEAEAMNHHPNLQITHHCTDGVTVSAKCATHSLAGAMSEFDFELARRISGLCRAEPGGDVAQHAPDIRMSDFSYELPDSFIAQRPPEPRGSSRLLVVVPEGDSGSSLLDSRFAALPELLPNGVHLVGNASRVIAARLFATGAHDAPGAKPVEVMFLSPEPDGADPAAILAQACEGQSWRCMVRRAIDVPGYQLHVRSEGGEADIDLQIVVEQLHSAWIEEGEPEGVEATVRLRCSEPETSMFSVFECLGKIPLPPYMRRAAEKSDRADYQTVYASQCLAGSVAAPTAGLHFTPELLQELERRGSLWSELALHVGAGTFRPVTAEKVAQHAMHAETFSMSTRALEDVASSLESGRPVVAVGTTSARALESLYWLGASPGSASGVLSLDQWEPYALAESLRGSLPSAAEALRRLCRQASERGKTSVQGSTRLCIVPGYDFKVLSALVTNFHQPDSTLLLLVAAMAGRSELLGAYQHALKQGYRFLSYGDASLFFCRPASAAMLRPASEAVAAARGATDGAACQPQKGEKVLLHSCCAPCSGAMIEEMHNKGLDVTILFYNPNIHPRKEYEIRKRENVRYAQKLGIPFVDGDYDSDEWYRRARGLEFSPERGARCTMCFDMRHEYTALHAHEHGFKWMTTTNATSRWKDKDQVNASGARAAAKYPDVQWWFYDWATESMTNRKYRINAEEAFYKQEYCGCSYSLRDSNLFRKGEGLPPIRVGEGDIYTDPERDAEEESLEVVGRFFEDANRKSKLRGTYSGRRKGASEENW